MKVINYENDTESLESFLDMLIKARQTFTTESTSYTTSIIWNGTKRTFSDRFTKGYLFPFAQKIKADVLKSNIHIDEVPRFDIDYFSISKYLKGFNAEFPGELYMVDINAAYPTVLRNAGFITAETYEYLMQREYVCELNKQLAEGKIKDSIYESKIKELKLARLKSVGMLATNKISFHYVNGVQSGYSIGNEDQEKRGIELYTRNIFFYAAYTVGEVMMEISRELGRDFLFFWVDGIYMLGEGNVSRVQSILDRHNFASKAEALRECRFEMRADNGVFSYAGKRKRKALEVPFNEDENKRNQKALYKLLKQAKNEVIQNSI